MYYFVSALLAMCGIACGIPLLFASHWLCRRCFPRDSRLDEYQNDTLALMEERNGLDRRKVAALEALCERKS